MKFTTRSLDRVLLDRGPALPPPVAFFPRIEERVEGAILLYDFNGQGNVLVDESPDPVLLSLVPGVDRIDGGIHFRDGATIASAAGVEKIARAVALSGEMSVEVWAFTDTALQRGPARLFSYSLDSVSRNFTIAQNGRAWNTRLRTSTGSVNGADNNGLSSPLDSAELGVIQHIVARFTGGVLEVFVDGTLASSTLWPGDLSTHDLEHFLVLGNERNPGNIVGNDRAWTGALYLAAVYDRALSDAEIDQNFIAGP